MREERISSMAFCEANRSTRVVQLIETIRRSGPAAVARLDEIGECWQMWIEDIEDLNWLRQAYLVRYRPNSRREAGWEYPGSLPYTVDEYASAVATINPVEHAKICRLASSIERSLSQDVVLVAAQDVGLGRRVIVDGVHRSVGLVLITGANPGGFARLFETRYRVSVVEFRSRLAHLLFPCDFLEFCQRSGGALLESS